MTIGTQTGSSTGVSVFLLRLTESDKGSKPGRNHGLRCRIDLWTGVVTGRCLSRGVSGEGCRVHLGTPDKEEVTPVTVDVPELTLLSLGPAQTSTPGPPLYFLQLFKSRGTP